MSVRVSGVYLMAPSPGGTPPGGASPPPPAMLVAPQRSNSLDYLNFEEKRQLIASSLSLSDFLHHGPAVAAAKGVEATKVIVAGKLLFMYPVCLTSSHTHSAGINLASDLSLYYQQLKINRLCSLLCV